MRRLSAAAALSTTIFRGKFAATHFCALLFEDGFAREPDAITFDGQDLYQDLIAFAKLILNVLYAMLGHFRDVKQSVRARNDFDECSELGKPSNFAEVGLPYFR